jgi:predicted acyltransferase
MQRNQSLDALRGFAILAMVLSGSIAFGDVLPAWMYHAQVPPPKHVFIPTLPGITWVDLVFPFFLFSMGAAIPLSLSKLSKEGTSFWRIVWIAARRYVLLTFFALFSFHMRAWVMAEAPATTDYLLSVFGFVLLCFQFYEYKGVQYKSLFISLKIAAFAIAVFLLYALPLNKGQGFSLEKSDIIIIVLANMAFFGTLTWWLTKDHPHIRIGLLPFIMAIFLGAKESGSWNEAVFTFSPLPWVYKFYYLKYLFIIIPGTFAGEWLLRYSKMCMDQVPHIHKNNLIRTAAILSLILLVGNIGLLFSRALLPNLILSILVLAGIYYFINKAYTQKDSPLLKFFFAGAYLLLLGLFFEAYEGGIKKDLSTYSYYFISAGLAFFILIGFCGLQLSKSGACLTHYLSLNGRNPMVAYVAGNLLLIPVLKITGGIQLLDSLGSNAWTGFSRGVLFTGIVSLITVLFVKKKWFWKT